MEKPKVTYDRKRIGSIEVIEIHWNQAAVDHMKELCKRKGYDFDKYRLNLEHLILDWLDNPKAATRRLLDMFSLMN